MFQIFVFIALLNGLVLIAALLSRRENRFANVILSGVVAAGLFFQFVLYLKGSGLIEEYPRFRRAGFPASLLDAPLLYLYVLSLTVPGFRWTRRHFLHFLPFVLGLLWYLAFFGFPLDSALWNSSQAFQSERYARTVIGVFVSGAYLFACLRHLRGYRSYVLLYFSELRRVRLRWLQWLLILFTGPWLVELIDVLTGPEVTMERYVVPLVTVIILLIGFFGLKQSVIFAPDQTWDVPPPQKAPPRRETIAGEGRNELFSEDELVRHKEGLEKLMAEQKPYLNPELRLFDLAKGLGLKAYQASELINRGFGTNFYEYVNRYRVEEAKRRLLEPAFAHMNILGIATDCGFNSKSVFNDVFRKMTGKTPSAYRTNP